MEPDVAEYGFKFHMNDLNATIGLVNLPHAPRIVAACQANGAYFSSQLMGLPGVTLLPPLGQGTTSAWWLYTIRVPAPARPAFMEVMKGAGVVVSAVHQRNDVHSCVHRFAARLPKLDVVAEELVCLPVGWWLTPADRERIVSAVKAFSASLTSRLEHPSTVLVAKPKPKCIITGGCGFIGHHVVEHFAKNTDYQLVVIDKLSYASKGYDRLRDTGVFHTIQTFCYDLTIPIPPGLFYELDSNNVEVILHIAAETHVDNSIDTPVPFVENNIKSTLNLLEYARKLPRLKSFIYFSTDEVFGSVSDALLPWTAGPSPPPPPPPDARDVHAPTLRVPRAPPLAHVIAPPGASQAADGQFFEETAPHNPSNPYSASKSAAEMICQSYYNTYGVPLMVMNVMNAFGERQHPEKFVPLCINKILKGETITIHAYVGAERAGSRWYIHARNIAAAVLFVLTHGKLGQKYNVQGERELDNLEVAEFVARELGRDLKCDARAAT